MNGLFMCRLALHMLVFNECGPAHLSHPIKTIVADGLFKKTSYVSFRAVPCFWCLIFLESIKKTRSNDGIRIISGCLNWAQLFETEDMVILCVTLFTCKLTSPDDILITLLRRLFCCVCSDICAMDTCVSQSQLCGSCDYCYWKDSGCPLENISDAFIVCPEAARLTSVYGPSFGIKRDLGVRLRQCGILKRPTSSFSLTSSTLAVSPGEQRLYKFLRLLRYMGTAPWANVNFAINDMILNRLTASHLHLITGKDEFKNCSKAKLYNAISPKINLQDAQNLIWVTNR